MSKDKLQKLENDHQIAKHTVLTDEYKQKSRDNALLILGGIRVADKIANSISSQVMNALITFQDQQMYLNFDCDNFVEFLETSDYAPMSKHQFYKRKEIFEAEGEKLFDLMNEVGVSFATRKFLSSGNYDAISFDGDKLKIGDQEADISNARLVRSLIESYADDYKRVKTESDKAKEKLTKAEATINAGYKKVEDLQKQLDGTPKQTYGAILTKTLVQFSEFTEFVEKLSDEEKAEYAGVALRSFSVQFTHLSNAFGVKKALKKLDTDDAINKLVDSVTDDFED